MSEELSERLVAPEGVAGRDALLRRLADVLGARGLYQQAARRLAQAGDKVKIRQNGAHVTITGNYFNKTSRKGKFQISFKKGYFGFYLRL